jgi:hypothetical protein
MAKITKTQVAKEQKQFLALIKKMPKVTSRSTQAQFNKLYDFVLNDYRLEVEKQYQALAYKLRDFLYQDPNYRFISPSYEARQKSSTLSARGWHKDHYNYNKAEKWELPPSLRRTPARNVTKAGTKRKRKTNIKKYK